MDPLPPHPHPDALRAFGLGRLDPAGADTVQQHLTACDDCRRAVAEASGDDFTRRLRAAQQPAPGSYTASGTAPAAAGPAPPPAAVPPELADHPEYEIVRELGRGGMGVVYLARNKEMGRREVLKVMGREVMDRPGAGERFRSEVQAAARLSHPNIVTAYSARPVGDLLVFAMEYVEGEDLSKVVAAGDPLAVRNACFYAHHAALGLQHAHEHGMVHRDIKPHNLILHRAGNRHTVKILDFGLAKVADDRPADHGLTREGQALGTPSYMAPEQIQDARSADTRSDIYSLGCTLYFLLAGRPPFQAESLYALFGQHIAVEATPLNQLRPDVPAELAAVVARMMAKNPADRFQTPVEASQALAPFFRAGGRGPAAAPAPAAVAAGHSSSTPEVWASLADIPAPAPVAVTPAPPPRRNPAPLWAAVAAGVAAVALVAALAGGLLRVKTPDGTIVVENVPADADVQVDGGTVRIARAGDEVTVQAVAGQRYPLRVVGKDGKPLLTRDVELVVGGAPVRVRVEPPAVAKAPPVPDTTPPAPTLSGKYPPPPPERLAALQKAAREGIRAELASGSPADLGRAAKGFLDRAESLKHPHERFALIDLARDLLAQAADITGALNAANRLDKEFVIDLPAVKVRALQQAAPRLTKPADEEHVTWAGLVHGHEALAADGFAAARGAAKVVAGLAHGPSREPQAAQARFLGAEADRAEAAFNRLPAAAKAADAPGTDPEANAARGLYAGLVQNDWRKAVEFLQAGTPAWAAVAGREAKPPPAAADLAALGDLWWEAAAALPPADAGTARRRARRWYLAALDKTPPPERAAVAARLQPRVDAVPQTPTTLRVRMLALNGYHWLRITHDGVVTSGRGGRKITGDITVNHLTWNGEVTGHRNVGAARLYPDGLDFTTAVLRTHWHSRWGAVCMTSTPAYIELTFWHMPSNDKSDFDLTIDIESGFAPPSRFIPQWDVAYFNVPKTDKPYDGPTRDALLKGEPADRVKLGTVNFVSEASPLDDWRPGAPPTKKVGTDYFALAATTTWATPAGRYRARTYADDGVRVFVAGWLVIDNWKWDGKPSAKSEEFQLPAGDHPVRVEYHQTWGQAYLQFDLVRVGE